MLTVTLVAWLIARSQWAEQHRRVAPDAGVARRAFPRRGSLACRRRPALDAREHERAPAVELGEELLGGVRIALHRHLDALRRGAAAVPERMVQAVEAPGVDEVGLDPRVDHQ